MGIYEETEVADRSSLSDGDKVIKSITGLAPFSLMFTLLITVRPGILIALSDVYYHSPDIKIGVCLFCSCCDLILKGACMTSDP